jgi:hypothetical protein
LVWSGAFLPDPGLAGVYVNDSGQPSPSGDLNTKNKEARFVADVLTARGETVVVDLSMKAHVARRRRDRRTGR